MSLFLSFLVIYTIILTIESNLFIIAIFTILFWVTNTFQVIKEKRSSTSVEESEVKIMRERALKLIGLYFKIVELFSRLIFLVQLKKQVT